MFVCLVKTRPFGGGFGRPEERQVRRVAIILYYIITPTGKETGEEVELTLIIYYSIIPFRVVDFV